MNGGNTQYSCISGETRQYKTEVHLRFLLHEYTESDALNDDSHATT